MKRLGIAALVFASLLSLSHARRAVAGQCSTSNLNGTYTGNAKFTANVSSNPSVEFTGVQTLLTTFDGKGKLSGTTTQVARTPFSNQQQFACVFTVSGTYTVAANGSGTIDYSFVPSEGPCTPGTATASILLGAGGTRIDIVGPLTIQQAGLNSFVFSGELFEQSNNGGPEPY